MWARLSFWHARRAMLWSRKSSVSGTKKYACVINNWGLVLQLKGLRILKVGLGFQVKMCSLKYVLGQIRKP